MTLQKEAYASSLVPRGDPQWEGSTHQRGSTLFPKYTILFLIKRYFIHQVLDLVGDRRREREREREREMAGRYCYENGLPFSAMVTAECTNVGLNILFKASSLKGLSYYVFVLYMYAFSTLVLFPLAFVFRGYVSFPYLHFSNNFRKKKKKKKSQEIIFYAFNFFFFLYIKKV